MNPINEKVLLTPEMCTVYRDVVFDARLYWLDRGAFYTLGASAYIDDPTIYPGMAANCNSLLQNNFGHLATLVANYIKEEFNREIIVFPNKGLPGFHIFNQESNHMDASIHTDEAHERLEWGCGVSDPFSFLIPIALPEAGGGLNWWMNSKPETEKQYLQYELGNLIMFAGDLPHQINNDKPMTDTDFRITYQGHGITLDTGKIAVYF